MSTCWLLAYVVLVNCWTHADSANKSPHIVMIVADDLGWDDVSFHGSPQIPTPNIDALAKEGVILNNYYVSSTCTQTRAAFMTGKYPIHLGLQHDVIHNRQSNGVPLTEHFLPQYLKEFGYSTHAVGKWHLGFSKLAYTPTYRGFDSFLGFWSGKEDYFNHVSYDGNYGLDLRRNLENVFTESGHYSTEMFTEEAVNIIKDHDVSKPMFMYLAHQAVQASGIDDPLQVPPRYVEPFTYITNERRRMYAGMVASLDESIKNITTALQKKGIFDETIIIFTTDNGGAAGGQDLNAGSNYPLRGVKNTLWEGGVRAVGFVHSSLIQKKGRVCNELIDASDWLPTLYSLAGGKAMQLGKIDGLDIWESISTDVKSPRYEILHGLDTMGDMASALRVGDYKIIDKQDLSYYGDWFPRLAEVHELDNFPKPETLAGAVLDCTIRHPHPLLYTHAPICDPRIKPCLFNIKWDPCEYHDLASFMPNTLRVMLQRLSYYKTTAVLAVYPALQDKAKPDLHDGIWTNWDEVVLNNGKSNAKVKDNLAQTTIQVQSPPPSPYLPPATPTPPKQTISYTKPASSSNKKVGVTFGSFNFTGEFPLDSDKTKENDTNSWTSNVYKSPTTTTSVSYGDNLNSNFTIFSVKPEKTASQSSYEPKSKVDFIQDYIDDSKPYNQPTSTEIHDVIDMSDQSNINFNDKLQFNTTDIPAYISVPNIQKPKNMFPFSNLKNPKPVDYPHIYDVIDESKFENLNKPATSKDIAQIVDVIDVSPLPSIQNIPAKTLHADVKHTTPRPQGTIATSKKLTQSDVGLGIMFSGKETTKDISKLLKESKSSYTNENKTKKTKKKHKHLHRFAGNITLDGAHKMFIVGTESDDLSWIKDKLDDLKKSNKALKTQADSDNDTNLDWDEEDALLTSSTKKDVNIEKTTTENQKTKVLVQSYQTDDGTFEKLSKSKGIMDDNIQFQENGAPQINEITDYIDDTIDEKPPLPLDITKNPKFNITTHKANPDTNSTINAAAKNTKMVEVGGSDNAIVVSSVVIVVIASAMVVGVAVVAMVAVIARHCQRVST